MKAREMKKRLEGFLDHPVEAPEPLELSNAMARRLEAFGFEIVYLPNIDLRRPIGHWSILPENRYWETEIVQRSRLSGRWVAIERRAMPEIGQETEHDPLIDAVHADSRIGHSWKTLHEMILPRLADILEVPRSRVRLPWLIERNFCGNLFAHLAGSDPCVPNWHAARVWEWCENRYGQSHALLTGRFGLASVGWCFSGDEWYKIFAWRSVVELSDPPKPDVVPPCN